MRPAYFNEIDPYCAAWLRNLIAAGHLPPGDVDERDIRAVQPADLAGYGQKHLFAGIGGFAYACRLAGVPDDADILTGGFPCQPFSVAGQQLAQQDDRHLWPEMYRLVERTRPAWVLGENVAGLVQLALDGVLADLERGGYASRAFVVPACAVDAPHRRDRVWIVARPVGDADGAGLAVGACEPGDAGPERPAAERAGDGAVEHADCGGRAPGQPAAEAVGHGRPAVANGGFWDDAGWIAGRDGKRRRVPQSGIRLLAARVPARVAKLRALGNAICPQVAAEILKAMMTTEPEWR